MVVMFGRREKNPPFKLEIDGNEIYFSSTVKYLGVTIDRKITWQAHIEEKIGKARKLVGLLRNATLSNWHGPTLYWHCWTNVQQCSVCMGT